MSMNIHSSGCPILVGLAHCIYRTENLGIWHRGSALTLHVRGEGIDTLVLHNFFCVFYFSLHPQVMGSMRNSYPLIPHIAV